MPITVHTLIILATLKHIHTLQHTAQDLPVFLKGPGDLPLYRGVMALSVVGIGLTLFSIYRMATGTMTKKSN